MTKHVIVPVKALEDLEQARVELVDFLEGKGISYAEYGHLSALLWRVANKRYPEHETKGE